jgi:hypothetical protein
MKFVGRIDFVGQSEYRVFERQQSPWIDVKFNMEIDRTTATVFGVQIDLPRLA